MWLKDSSACVSAVQSHSHFPHTQSKARSLPSSTCARLHSHLNLVGKREKRFLNLEHFHVLLLGSSIKLWVQGRDTGLSPRLPSEAAYLETQMWLRLQGPFPHRAGRAQLDLGAPWGTNHALQLMNPGSKDLQHR